MGIFDDWGTKSKIRRLEKYKSDLTDDHSAIANYNKEINDIISDYQKFVRRDNYAVVNLLEDFKEPYQYNDGNLNSSCRYIEKEITKLSNELED